jgi:acetylornithine deacetylase/succinyl-diaminopimelate desuccinylase family protein
MFEVLGQLQKAIESRRAEMAALTAELVAIDTENPPGRNYERCIRLVGERLGALGFGSRIEPVPGGDANREYPRFWLRAALGEPGPTVYFHGHYDVVPAQSRDQFTPRVTDDTIFGRGSTDMKGGLVSMIYAMWALRETGAPLNGRIALQVVPDEETGGALGSRALSDHGLLLGDNAVAMLTAEPTGGLVWHASRGAITCHVTVRGRQSHVGLAYRGINAFEHMLGVTDALRSLEREVHERSTLYPIEPEEARRSILMMGGEVSGGANFNVVPENFTFSIKRRINPEEDFDTEKKRLLDTILSTDADVEVDLFQEARPAGVSETDPVADALRAAIAEVTGKPARFELCPGILEIRFYSELGIPAFAYGPGLLTVAHGPKELIKRHDMENVALVYAMTAAKLLSP